MGYNVDFYDMQTNGKTEPALLVRYEAPTTRNGSTSAHGTLRLSVVEVHADSRSIRNYADGWRDKKGFADLGAHIYMFNDTTNTTAPVSFRMEYRDVYSIELERAEKMAKTLRSINNKGIKQQQELGFADSTGEAVRRLALAIGAKHIIFDEVEYHGVGGYDDNRANYTWRTLGDGKNEVNSLQYRHYRKFGPLRTEETADA